MAGLLLECAAMYRPLSEKTRWNNRAGLFFFSFKIRPPEASGAATGADKGKVSDPQHACCRKLQMRHIGRIFRLARIDRPA
jgi:hypothetical protein